MSETKDRRFGDVIREARLRIRPPLSLRQFAIKLGIAAAYLSKIESNLDRPPAAKVVEKMTEILDLDKMQMLQLAERVPTEFEEAFKRDQRAPEFMRLAMESGMTPDGLRELIEKEKAKKP